MTDASTPTSAAVTGGDATTTTTTDLPPSFVWPTDASGYELVNKIGQGAFATVYLAKTTTDDTAAP